jgi:hypothetical protein
MIIQVKVNQIIKFKIIKEMNIMIKKTKNKKILIIIIITINNETKDLEIIIIINSHVNNSIYKNTVIIYNL